MRRASISRGRWHFAARAQSRPELAWTLHDFAGMLVEQDGEGDKAKATTMLDEASQISTALNIRPLMERLLSKGDNFKA